MQPKRIVWSLSLSFFLLLTISSPAQSTRPAPKGTSSEDTAEEDEGHERIARDMAKKANLQRQAALKSDTDKLVKLAGELKEYVDKSNENMLSLDVLKKAEEIERLAKSVKEKMKGGN